MTQFFTGHQYIFSLLQLFCENRLVGAGAVCAIGGAVWQYFFVVEYQQPCERLQLIIILFFKFFNHNGV